MTAGDDTFMGLAVPLRGESTIKALTTAGDILTIEGSSSTPTGDYIVCRYGDGTEKFVVAYTGAIATAVVADAGITTSALSVTGVLSATGFIDSAAGVRIATNKHLRFSTPITTIPAGASGWTKGDVFVCIPSTAVPMIGVAVASTPTIYYFRPTTTTFAYGTFPK